MFNMALAGTRDENPFVDHARVQDDVNTLTRAGPGKIGTVSSLAPWLGCALRADRAQDEIAICGILLSRSDQHLQALAQAYQAKHRHALSDM